MEWYEKKLRRNLVDMHIDDWDPVFLSKFDPDTYVELLKLGNINAPMIYLQSHVGLCYWPTKSGKMHESFTGRPEMIREVERKCHRAGMSVIAYYSLIYNNWAYDAHPPWRMKDINGKGSREEGGRYGLCCPNHPEYRAFTEVQLAELSEYFDFEGIFLDMTFWPMVCYCDQCKARWAKEVGGDMPTVVDWNDPAFRKFQDVRSEWIGEFAIWATSVMEKYKPGCAVEHQYSPIMHYWRFGVDENMTVASTYAGGDLYGGISEQSFACKLYYNVTRAQPFEYMTSRCYPGLSEHTTTKSMDLLKLSVMMTYLHHGACLLIDAIDPVGTMDRRVYERFGAVYRETEKYEKWLSWGQQAFDVSLYYDLHGKYDPDQPKGPIGSGGDAYSNMPMQRALLGAARSLREHHIPYGVVNNWKMEPMHKGKVIALCDVPDMGEEQQDQVLSYIKGGGRAYLSGRSAPKLLKEIFGLEVKGLTAEDVTYISPTEAGQSLMEGAFTYDYPLVMFERQAEVAGAVKGTVLGTLTLPYTLPNSAKDAASPFFAKAEGGEAALRFASIHSNPPGKYRKSPALVRAKYGAGEAVWCALPIEKAAREQHSDIFARIIKELLGDEPAFAAKAPEFVECVLFDAPEQDAKVMGVINVQESFRTQPAYNFDVSVRTDVKPARAYLLPGEEPLNFTYENGMATVHFDRMDLYAMYVLEGVNAK